MEKAVGTTLELEYYLMTPKVIAVSQVSSEREDTLMDMLAQLMRRMDQLEATTSTSLSERHGPPEPNTPNTCLLYTSDAADE